MGNQKYQLLEHTIECKVKYIISYTYELPIKSTSLFDKIINDAFSISISGKAEEDEIRYRNFQLSLDSRNILVDVLVFEPNKVSIKFFDKSKVGETILNKILDEYKKAYSISPDKKLVKSCEYSTYIKAKSNLKVSDLIKKEAKSLLEKSGEESKKLYGEEFQVKIHPYLIRSVIQLFPPGSNLDDSRLISKSYIFAIQHESFEEYIEGITSFYSELPYETHVKLIENFLKSL
ncbi:MAG: hypothetical protein KAU46_10535 [Candidatus Aminicenantes bacterium]|nr:hypothetical protein [Candidatus Aminicenantes bacterium]